MEVGLRSRVQQPGRKPQTKLEPMVNQMALTFKPKTAPIVTPANVSPFMTTEEVAALLCLSVDYLKRDRWLAKSAGTPPKFPFYKLAGAVRYKRDEVLAILEQGRVG